MAVFTCYAATNNFIKGFPPPFDYYPINYSGFQLNSPDYYEYFSGNSGYYSNSIPYGYVYTYGFYDYGNNLLFYWDANGGLFSAPEIFNLKDNYSWRDFFEYMLYFDDNIYGSPFNDKLNGFTGNDFIAGNEGNDKLKGGAGFDDFYFEAFDGRDVIKDFKWWQDAIFIDSSLAVTLNQVYNAAYTYKKGMVLDFGNTIIKIPKLNPGNFDDVDFFLV